MTNGEIKARMQILIDRGLLVEAGFVAFEHFFIASSASQKQRLDMRLAFMAGAEHMFTTLIEDATSSNALNEEIMNWRRQSAEKMERIQ